MPSIPELEAELAALRAENSALQRSRETQQQLLRAIADHAPIVLYAKDPAGRFTLSNRLHAALLGRAPQEVLGVSEAELVGEAAAAEIQAVVDVVARTGEPQVGEFSIPVAGALRVFLEHVFPLGGSGGEVGGIGGAAIDITARKRAEDEVRVFAALTEHSPDGVLVRAADPSAPMRANPALRRILGLDAAAPAELAAARLEMAGPGTTELVNDLGAVVSLEVTAFEIPGADGAPMATATVARDVTHLQRALREREEQVEINRKQQAELIAELSAPLLPLAPGVLVLPLIGSLDEVRSLHVREVALESIAAQKARVLIVDLTGLRAVDGIPADHLINLIMAVQLIGTRVIVTGIRPAVASALVDFGFSPGRGLAVVATLADAIRMTLK